MAQTRARWVARALGTLAASALLGAVVAQPQGGPTRGAAAIGAAVPGAAKKFEHRAHEKKGVAIGGHCGDCHANGNNGAPLPPGRDGHQPCLRGSCHVQDFLSLTKDFCLGCHGSADNFRANPAINVFKNNPSPGFYVEMSHARHMGRPLGATSPQPRPVCWTCHEVDATTFAAVASPGHLQCATCHGTPVGAGRQLHPTMGECEGCHHRGHPGAYFTGRRPASDVKKHFIHEVKAHRYTKRGEPLQCSGCHYMVAEIDTLKALKARKIVDERTMNVYCAKCHDVAKTERGGCLLCHDRDIYSKLIPPSHRP
jgi:hypothetical protein